MGVPQGNKMLEIEQKKLLTILEANEKIQQKLNKLLSMSPGSKNIMGGNSDDEYGTNKYPSYGAGKKLPGMNQANPFSKMSQQKYMSSYERKKHLKPISKEKYDRLTGFNKLSGFEHMGNSQGFNQQTPMTKEEQFNQMQRMHQTSQIINQNIKSEEKSGEEKAKDSSNQFDMSKIDPQFIQSFLMMSQNYQNMVQTGSSTKPTQSVKKHVHNPRFKRELDPICNLGFIPTVTQNIEQLKLLEEERKKN